MELKERLLGKIKIDTNGCWNWTGALRGGYGCVSINKKLFAAHRLSYEVYISLITDNLFVCHKCDNPKCINPNHLFLGTHKDNMKDAFDKGRLVIPTGNQFKVGNKPKHRSLTDEQVTTIKNDMVVYKNSKTLKEIALIHGVSYQVLKDMRRKKPQSYFNNT